MCGRFALNAAPQLVQQTFNLDAAPLDLRPRFNIAPSQPIAVITNQNAQRLTFFKWGLVPSWSKDPSAGYKMINARAETAPEKPSFRDALKKRRCLIPATGFFEWAKDDKTPMYIHMQDDSLFAFAGLWETWTSPEGETLNTCTILTTEPNELLSRFHHRMAVILPKDAYAAWLNPDPVPSSELTPLLLPPYPADQMEAYPISKLVNNTANDSPAVIARIETNTQLGLL